MALYQSLLRPCSIKILRCCAVNLTKIQFSDSINTKNLHVEVDVIDEFTNQLVQNKSEKWAKRKWKASQIQSNQTSLKLNKKQSSEKQLDVRLLSISEINATFEKFIQVDDYDSQINLIKECIKYKKLPEHSVVDEILNVSFQRGEKDIIIQLQKLYEQLSPDTIETNRKEYFKYFLAGAIWMKGDIIKSLALYEEVYRRYSYLRRKIRLSLSSLISEAATNKSEAALKIIVDFCECLQNEFNDSYLLCSIWQHCFLSEWFSDQSLSIELLERNENLCDAVSNKIPYVVAVSLQGNRLDIVHRLLEYLLKNDKKTERTGVLVALFDYHLRHRNLKSCSAILQWCKDNDVILPCINNAKFINLLIFASQEPGRVTSVKPEEKYTTKYNFKF